MGESTYPNGPIRLVIPFPPGGSTGYTAKVLADALQAVLGQPVTLDPRPGKFGINAIAELVGRADGRTLMVGTITTNSMTPVWHREDIAFDYQREIVPVTRVADFPSVVMVSSTARAGTLADFIAEVKRDGSRLTLGADFIGSFGDVDAVMLAEATGVEIAFHCNPDGANGLLQDLLAGKSNFAFLNVATASANTGRFKPLAVTGPARLANFSDVPTMAEAGFPELEGGPWFGLMAPAGAPRAVIDWLNAETRKAFAAPDVRDRFLSQGMTLPLGTPEEFSAFIAAESVRWGDIVRKTGIKMD
jgi:tripartite-type tricarboxylate transporter receptor subunit TctC